MITVVVGKEIEKIKGDFESYLNGLNMVGEISYSQYSELYDEGTKQIQKAYELGKSELEQAEKGKVVERFEAYGQCRDSRRIADLETKLKHAEENCINKTCVVFKDKEDCVAKLLELEKENAELKVESDFYNKERGNYKALYLKEVLKKNKAKELLKKLYEETRGYMNDQGFDMNVINEVYDFINSEVEK